MTGVDVQHRENAKRFVARTPSGLAYISYQRPDDGTIDLQHTVVPEADRGRGIGGALVRTAVGYAREQGLRVIPTCPFVKAWLEGHPDQRDVLR
ncbi:MAG: GNAT family N-acetyltransferase [Gemmatimonadaceae bacterium]